MAHVLDITDEGEQGRRTKPQWCSRKENNMVMEAQVMDAAADLLTM